MTAKSTVLVCGAMLAAILVSEPAKAGDFYGGGEVCQRASSGYIVCRDPGDRYSNGYVVGGHQHFDRDAALGRNYDSYNRPGRHYDDELPPRHSYGHGYETRRAYGYAPRPRYGYDEPAYGRGGQVCQRASSGYLVCRDRGDRWSNGYVVGR